MLDDCMRFIEYRRTGAVAVVKRVECVLAGFDRLLVVGRMGLRIVGR
jgi:hypothetical protein